MKKLLLFLLLFSSITATAEYDLSSKCFRFSLHEDDTLCFRDCWSVHGMCFKPLRDTILADGTVSKIYTSPITCYGYPDRRWRYLSFPDSVDVLLPCNAEFYYPMGLKSGFYNFAEDFAYIKRLNEDGTPIFENQHKDSLETYYRNLSEKINERVRNSPPHVETPEPEPSSSDDPCTIQVNGKTIPLYGRVQVVTSFGDIKVAESNFPDLRVKSVNISSGCGEWQFVDSNPDFTIEYSNFPDLKIEFSNFPGIP